MQTGPPGLRNSLKFRYTSDPRAAANLSFFMRAQRSLAIARPVYSFTLRRRKALLMTETELRLIAAPAMIGLSSRPKKG